MVGVVIAISVVDIVTGPGFRLGTLLVVPPLVAAIFCRPGETLVVAIFAFSASVGSGFWNETFGDATYWARVLGVGVANGLAVVVSALRHQLQVERARAMLLAESGELLEETLERDATLATVAALAVPALADAASVDLYDPDRNSISSVHISGAGPESARRMHLVRDGFLIDAAGAHPVAKVVRSGQTLHVSRDQMLAAGSGLGETAGLRDAVVESGIRRGLIVPLRARGRMLGAMTMVSFGDRDWDPGETAVAEEFGRRAAYALDNARRHGGQAHIADVLQRSLRPDRIPNVPSMEIAARFLPAGEQNAVGGDFYDVIELADGAFAAVIGDVSGKGAEAAAITAIARNALRAEPLLELSPSEALRGLNAVLCQRLGSGRFCTVALARITTGDDGAAIRFSLGGHPRPLVMRQDGSVEELGSQGTLLGGFLDPRLTDSTALIAPGETLVLYTDGALESRGPTGNGGGRGAIGHVARDLIDLGANGSRVNVNGGYGNGAGGEAEWVAAYLEHRALERQHGHQRDDIAILVLRPT